MKKDKKTEKRYSYPTLSMTTILMFCFVIVAGILVYFSMDKYERGVLDVAATQQDAYIELVLDQINLKDNRDNEEIIEDILGTLDASTNKYWTFSSDTTMLFVKDVLETNKYKGFTTQSYFHSESARSFLKSLKLNKVTHSNILMNDKKYVASGVKFQYDGKNYDLCLLTNRDALLDNNMFLEAKTELLTVIVVVLLLLLLIPMIYAYIIRRLQITTNNQLTTIYDLNKSLTDLNERYAKHDLHDTRFNVWKKDAFIGFIKKLKQRNVVPMTVVQIHFQTIKDKENFLEKAHCTLDKKVLRFEMDSHTLILLFIQCDQSTTKNELQYILTKETVVEKIYTISDWESTDIDLF